MNDLKMGKAKQIYSNAMKYIQMRSNQVNGSSLNDKRKYYENVFIASSIGRYLTDRTGFNNVIPDIDIVNDNVFVRFVDTIEKLDFYNVEVSLEQDMSLEF